MTGSPKRHLELRHGAVQMIRKRKSSNLPETYSTLGKAFSLNPTGLGASGNGRKASSQQPRVAP